MAWWDEVTKVVANTIVTKAEVVPDAKPVETAPTEPVVAPVEPVVVPVEPVLTPEAEAAIKAIVDVPVNIPVADEDYEADVSDDVESNDVDELSVNIQYDRKDDATPETARKYFDELEDSILDELEKIKDVISDTFGDVEKSEEKSIDVSDLIDPAKNK
jgi:hypothetical protein